MPLLLVLWTACTGVERLHTATPPAGEAPLVTGADILWFDLDGGDRLDLISSCASTCPHDGNDNAVASLTTWAVDWTWLGHRTEPCVVVSPDVHVDVTVALPRWSPPAGTDPALIAEWGTYTTALARHEQGHVDLVYDVARDSADGLAGVPCIDAHAASAGLLTDLRQVQAAYDVETRHGRTQGADFWHLEGRAVAQAEATSGAPTATQ